MKTKKKSKPIHKSKPGATTTAATSRQFLRHTLATLAYRGGKALRGTPAGFEDFHANETTRTPAQILAHIGDLLDWALTQANGKEKWHNAEPQSWEQDVRRFHGALQAFDDFIASNQPLKLSAEKLFQGAIADALTHVGQISMLRRLASAPMRSENYSRADIIAGRLDAEQTPPGMEFD